MGIIMFTVWFPPDKNADIARLYLKAPRKIPHVKKWRVFNTSGGVDGMKQYHLIYTDRGEMEEATTEIMKYFVPFLNIEGFRYHSEMLLGVSDSYELIGMKWD